MALTMPDQSELDPGGYVDAECWAHLYVTAVEVNPISKANKMIDGVRLNCIVRAASAPTQVKRLFNPILNNPNMSHRDGGAFAQKVQIRMLIACSAIPATLPKGTVFEENWPSLAHRQFVCKIKMDDEGESGKAFAKIDGAQIYHVDDPAVKDVPKDATSLRLMKGGAGGTQPQSGSQGKAPAVVATQQPVQQQLPAVNPASPAQSSAPVQPAEYPQPYSPPYVAPQQPASGGNQWAGL